MKFCLIINLSLVLDSIFYADAMPPDPIEKDWLDQCDLKRLKLQNAIETTTEKLTTKKGIAGSLPILGPIFGTGNRKVKKYPKIDVEANFEQLIKELKSKLTMDANERGNSPELESPNLKDRLIDLEYYMYSNEGPIKQFNSNEKPNIPNKAKESENDSSGDDEKEILIELIEY
ncbi:uncharacterized protein LOC123675197 isoform X1 [Harmonia axyridis]|uniref:uncharacterized protein LOC123675197 isoform X1 n=1 Tax=Harmonia axyridis TaxID=115357 RepID=UPI001E2783EF|nr:uncharacterized protein LOC123675197 isoform X1 [Harmonia axyridis]